MKKTISILFILIVLVLTGFKNKKPAYLIYPSGKDKDIAWEKLLKAASEADVVFFGEEADDQIILDEYLNGLIKEKHFSKESKVWPNYDTDYAPLVNFAKDNSLNFIATNVPRRYANLVSRKGLESLDGISEAAKAWIAPLPIEVDMELPGYKKIAEMMAGMHSKDPDSGKRIALAQAVKDATMGWFISSNLKEGNIMIHYNGSYHSNDHEGTVYYLKKYKPGVKVLTITTVEQDDITLIEEDNKKLADFIVVVPSDMTKTY